MNCIGSAVGNKEIIMDSATAESNHINFQNVERNITTVNDICVSNYTKGLSVKNQFSNAAGDVAGSSKLRNLRSWEASVFALTNDNALRRLSEAEEKFPSYIVGHNADHKLLDWDASKCTTVLLVPLSDGQKNCITSYQQGCSIFLNGNCSCSSEHFAKNAKAVNLKLLCEPGTNDSGSFDVSNIITLSQYPACFTYYQF